ncbi:MAG: S-layer homology domain-containing protein [Clostridia bacterium]|nr:S-layer homology domain-containing protein [Clostridia bacterium]
MKKITALILSFILIIPTITAFAFSDTEGTDYEKAVNVLAGLGIVGGYKDGTFKPDDNITRAEFAAMLTRMLDTSMYTVSKNPIFTDVGKRHWALSYVNTGFAAGYFSGYGDGTFMPDVNIKFAEVAKTLVTILGYKDLAEVKGGYPTGYIKIANENGLLKGLSLASDEYITRGDVAVFIYNCLDCPKFMQTVFGDGKIEYAKDPNHTVLTDEMDLFRHEGVVTSNRHAGLYGTAPIEDDEILIDGVKIATGTSDIASYLGYKLVVYAKEDEKTKDETVVFYEISDDNIVTTINADDIDESTNMSYISWWNGEKQESCAFSSDVQLIENGKNNPYYSSADLKPKSGTVTLLSNNGDRNADIVIIRSYTHYVVEKTDPNELVIYDKYGKEPLDLEPDDKDVDYSIIRKGIATNFKNIVKGTILSVVKSDDGQYMEIYVSTDVVRGSVTSVEDGNIYTIGEDNKTYERSSDLPENQIIKLGDTGLFYLDIEGRIIYADVATEAEGNYAYLLNAGIESGLDKKFSIRILNSKGEYETLSVSEKITLNGSKKTFDELISDLGGQGTVVKQPIKYAQNDDGIVTKLELPQETDPRAGRTFRRGTRMFGYAETDIGFLIKDEHTVMFQVPTTPTSDERDYKVITYTDLQNYKTTYNVTGYDREKLVVGCAVIDVDNVSTGYELLYDACVLEKITTAVNEDGEMQTKLYFMQAGKMISNVISDRASLYEINCNDKYSSSSLLVSSLKPGDVFYIMLDGNKEIKSLARVLSVGTNPAGVIQFGGYGRGVSTEKAFGRPLLTEDNGLLLRVDGRGDYLFDFTKPQGKLYLYDIKTETVRTATVADIMDLENAGDNAAYMYIACHTGEVTDAVIYYQPR